MMRLAMMTVGMSIVLAGSAVAQQAGVSASRGVRGRTYGSPSGFGNVVYPGTGSAPPIPNPFYRHPTTFAQRLGATVSGFPGYQIGGRSYRGSYAPAAIPYVMPVYVGGYYAAPPPVQPAVTVVNPPQFSPPVIINQYYTVDAARPVVRDITGAGLPEPASGGLRSYQAPVPSHPEPEQAERRNLPEDGQPTIYLIAYKDHSIYSAVGYWVDGDTLHYITTRGSHNRASLDLIDREFSEQLNRERNVEFKLEIPD